ncbi:MAG: DNA starvation/stationary phase protection protein [Bryobacteraceae bacterium]
MSTPSERKPNLGLSDEVRGEAVLILTRLIADEYVLYTKTRNYHWNVKGPQFHDLHLLFEKQYEQLDDTIDTLAEFVRGLGGHAPGTLAEFLKTTRLTEQAGQHLDASQMLANLLDDHETIQSNLRTEIGALAKIDEVGSADLLTGILEDHQKIGWMLRATLAK